MLHVFRQQIIIAFVRSAPVFCAGRAAGRCPAGCSCCAHCTGTRGSWWSANRSRLLSTRCLAPSCSDACSEKAVYVCVDFWSTGFRLEISTSARIGKDRQSDRPTNQPTDDGRTDWVIVKFPFQELLYINIITITNKAIQLILDLTKPLSLTFLLKSIFNQPLPLSLPSWGVHWRLPRDTFPAPSCSPRRTNRTQG